MHGAHINNYTTRTGTLQQLSNKVSKPAKVNTPTRFPHRKLHCHHTCIRNFVLSFSDEPYDIHANGFISGEAVCGDLHSNGHDSQE